MAEVGVIASVVQIADIGFKLSVKLYAFTRTVTSADKAIASICRDVKLTSTVLKELGNVLKEDTNTHMVNENAMQTADGIVKECLEIFQEMDTIFLKRTPMLRQDDEGDKSTVRRKMMERLWWPYIQPKVLFLRANLERLKSTLLLMLNVITPESSPDVAKQKKFVQRLNRSNQKRARQFEQMKRSTPFLSIAPMDLKADSDFDARTDDEVSSFKSKRSNAIPTPVDTNTANVRSQDTEQIPSGADGQPKDRKASMHASSEEHQREEFLGEEASGKESLREGTTRSRQGISSENLQSNKSRASSPQVIDHVDLHASSADLDESKPVGDVSSESSSRQQTSEAGQSGTSPYRRLLDHLEHYTALIDDLITHINGVPEAVPPGSRQMLVDVLSRACLAETGRLVAEHGQTNFESAAKSIGLFERSISGRIAMKDIIVNNQLNDEHETKTETANITVKESDGIVIDETKHDCEEITTKQMLNASSVHDLLKAGWKFSTRSKSSSPLSERLKHLKSGTGIYMKPVKDCENVHNLPSKQPTLFSIGINLPNFRRMFSPSIESLIISTPENLVRLTETRINTSAATISPSPATATQVKIDDDQSAAPKVTSDTSILEEAAKTAAAAPEAAAKPFMGATPIPNSNSLARSINFKDAIGRSYVFPLELCQTWRGMEYLIKEAFLHVEVIGPHVANGAYDLVGPRGQIIMSHVWEHLVQPGWEISMHMWPIPEPEPPQVIPEVPLNDAKEESASAKKAKPQRKKPKAAKKRKPATSKSSAGRSKSNSESGDNTNPREDKASISSDVLIIEEDSAPDEKHKSKSKNDIDEDLIDTDESLDNTDTISDMVIEEVRYNKKKSDARGNLVQRKARRHAVHDKKNDEEAVNDLLVLWTRVAPDLPEDDMSVD